jgi:hypothetical protein
MLVKANFELGFLFSHEIVHDGMLQMAKIFQKKVIMVLHTLETLMTNMPS